MNKDYISAGNLANEYNINLVDIINFIEKRSVKKEDGKGCSLWHQNHSAKGKYMISKAGLFWILLCLGDKQIIWEISKFLSDNTNDILLESIKSNMIYTPITHKEKVVKDIYKTYVAIDHKTGLYKIGRSQNPHKRMKQLNCIQASTAQDVQLFAICEKDIEKEMHIKFARKRTIGEWFKLDQNDFNKLRVYGFEKCF